MGGELYNPQTKVYNISIYLVYKRYILPIKWLCITYHPLQELEKSFDTGMLACTRPSLSCVIFCGVGLLLRVKEVLLSCLARISPSPSYWLKIPWAPKNQWKNQGFGHLKTKWFTIKTSKNVGFGGPWLKFAAPRLQPIQSVAKGAVWTGGPVWRRGRVARGPELAELPGPQGFNVPLAPLCSF